MSMFNWFRGNDPLANASENFKVFYRNYIGASVGANEWNLVRDGLDESIFAKLTPDELAEAERLMLQQLPQGDSRPAIGLGLIGSKQATSQLRSLMDQQLGKAFASSAYALALWRVVQDPEAIDAVAAIAADTRQNTALRTDAVRALGEMRADKSRQILLDLLGREPEYLLRYHSFLGVLTLHGYPWPEASRHVGNVAPQIAQMLKNPSAAQTVMAKLDELTAGREIAIKQR